MKLQEGAAGGASRSGAGLVFLFLAAILIPRFSGVVENVTFADDGIERASGVYHQYRFLAAAQLQLGETIDPGQYMLGRAPKLVSVVTLALAAVLLQQYSQAIGASRAVSVGVVLLLLCHPVCNDAILWNTAALILGLPVLLVAAALVLAIRSRSRTGWIVSSALFAIGISGYQLLAGAALALAAFGWLALDDRGAGRRVLSAVLAGGSLYGAAVLGVRWCLSWSPESAGRDVFVSLSRMLSPEFLRAKAHGVLDILSTVWQPVISLMADREAAYRLWYVVWLTVWIAGVVGLYRRVSGRRRLLALGTPFLSVIPLLPLLGARFSSVGYRSAMTVLLGTLPALVAAGMALEESARRVRLRRPVVWLLGIPILLVLGVLSLASARDTRFRVIAAARDRELIAEIGDAWKGRHGAPAAHSAVLCPWSDQRATPEADCLVAGSQALGPHTYSNLALAWGWTAFARRHGLAAAVSGEAPDDGSCESLSGAAEKLRSRSWPHVGLVHDRIRGVTFVIPEWVAW